MSSVRVFTNLTTRQYADLTKWCVRNDRSVSYAVSKALTDHLSSVGSPYSGEADIKVMSRTTPENAEAVRQCEGVGWRWINAAVDRLVSND